MSLSIFRVCLKEAVDKAGRQADVAAAAGVSQAHVSDVLNGKADPDDRLLDSIGWRREVIYKRKPRSGWRVEVKAEAAS